MPAPLNFRAFQRFSEIRLLRRAIHLSCFRSGSKNSLKVLFLGSDEFSLEHLKVLHEATTSGIYRLLSNFKVSKTDRPNTVAVDSASSSSFNGTVSFDQISSIDVVALGANSSVTNYARQHRIDTFDWQDLLHRASNFERARASRRDLAHPYDLGVVASFGKLIPENVINLARFGMINVHPSVLPRWRGASPIVYTIVHGDSETGVTIMKIAPRRFDVGDILTCEQLPVPPHSTTASLRDHLARAGSRLLLQCVANIDHYLEKATPQTDLATASSKTASNRANGEVEVAPLARKIQPTMFRIDWNAISLEQIDRLHRGLSALGDLRTAYRDTPIRLTMLLPAAEAMRIAEVERSQLLANAADWVPGTVRYSKQFKVLLVLCGADRNWCAIDRLVFRKPQTAADFNSGFISKTSDKRLVFESLPGNPFLERRPRPIACNDASSSTSSPSVTKRTDSAEPGCRSVKAA